MDQKEAQKHIEEEHIKEAARLVNENGIDWLLERTGCSKPKHRYLVFSGTRYPTKSFGFLVAQLAGNTDRKKNDLTANEAFAPLKRFSCIDVEGLDSGKSGPEAEADAVRRSY